MKTALVMGMSHTQKEKKTKIALEFT